MDLVFKLAAIEEIKALKARYFRCVDTKDWDGLQRVFSPNIEFDRTVGVATRDPWTGAWTPPLPDHPIIVSGRDAVMQMVRGATENIHTIHHGFMPEIDIFSETRAAGVWAMRDELRDRRQRLILSGSGHYHETYERSPDGWTIRTAKLTRLSLTYGEGRRDP